MSDRRVRISYVTAVRDKDNNYTIDRTVKTIDGKSKFDLMKEISQINFERFTADGPCELMAPFKAEEI